MLSELEYRSDNVLGFCDCEALFAPVGLDDVVGLSPTKARKPSGQDEYPVVRPCVRIGVIVPGRGLHDLVERPVVVAQFIDDPCDKQALFFGCLHSVVEDTKKPPRFGWSILYSLATVLLRWDIVPSYRCPASLESN